jgi:hypothetical protein
MLINHAIVVRGDHMIVTSQPLPNQHRKRDVREPESLVHAPSILMAIRIECQRVMRRGAGRSVEQAARRSRLLSRARCSTRALVSAAQSSGQENGFVS